MKTLNTLFLFIIALPHMASACPDPTQSGEFIAVNTDEPYASQSFQAIAGGDNQLETLCPEVITQMRSDKGDGWFTTAPNYSLATPNISQYTLDISAVSMCDTNLLIYTAADNYYYDDNDLIDFYPLLSMENPRKGIIDIWIGTHTAEQCEAILNISITKAEEQ